MGFFNSVSSLIAQLGATDTPEPPKTELFADFDDSLAELQQFDLEAFDGNNKPDPSEPLLRNKK